MLSAALKLAETSPPGTNIVAVLPDTGERYISTDLFKDIPEEMTPEELELSATTASKPPPPAPWMHGMLPADTDELFDL